MWGSEGMRGAVPRSADLGGIWERCIGRFHQGFAGCTGHFEQVKGMGQF